MVFSEKLKTQPAMVSFTILEFVSFGITFVLNLGKVEYPYIFSIKRASLLASSDFPPFNKFYPILSLNTMVCSNRTALLILLKGWRRNHKSYGNTDKFIIRMLVLFIWWLILEQLEKAQVLILI